MAGCGTGRGSHLSSFISSGTRPGRATTGLSWNGISTASNLKSNNSHKVMILSKNENGYYEVRVKGPDGKFKSRSTGRKNKDEALEFIRDAKIKEIETAAEMGVLSQDVASILITGRSPITVEDAIQPWADHMAYRHLSPRTISGNVTWVKAWMAWARIGKKPVSALKLEDFDGWVNGNECQNKLGTRNVMLSALRSFCRFCQDSGWIQGNPANLIQVDISRLLHAQKETLKRPIFTEEEVQRLIEGTAPDGANPDYFWHAAVVIGRYTGLRLGDICRLEWDCLNLEKNTLSVWTQKRDRRVELPLEPKILKETFWQLKREHPVFMFNYQKGLAIDPTCRAYLSIQFTKIMRALEIPLGKSFHCLRATYITDCDAKGIPIEHIARNVGHFWPQMRNGVTAGYIRPA